VAGTQVEAQHATVRTLSIEDRPVEARYIGLKKPRSFQGELPRAHAGGRGSGSARSRLERSRTRTLSATPPIRSGS